MLNHAHFESRTQKKFLTDNTLPRHAFRLRHYAGYVTYDINTFLDKNRDTLYYVCAPTLMLLMSLHRRICPR